MKELVKNSRVSGYLEKIFRQLNEDKFHGELEMPIITIQNTPKAYGHVSCNKVWHSVKGTEQYELNIGAGKLNRPIESVVATMLHEMVHLYNLAHDVKDTSRGDTYHNNRFKAKAEEVGLVIEYDSRIGWSVTSPSESLIDYIISQGWEDICIFRQGVGNQDPGGSEKKPSSTRKYQCPHCRMSVRATKTVRIICADCEELMQLCD